MSEMECTQLHSELFRRRHSTRQSHGFFALAKHLLILDIRALWRSGLTARAPECQKLTTVGQTSVEKCKALTGWNNFEIISGNYLIHWLSYILMWIINSVNTVSRWGWVRWQQIRRRKEPRTVTTSSFIVNIFTYYEPLLKIVSYIAEVWMRSAVAGADKPGPPRDLHVTGAVDNLSLIHIWRCRRRG